MSIAIFIIGTCTGVIIERILTNIINKKTSFYGSYYVNYTDDDRIGVGLYVDRETAARMISSNNKLILYRDKSQN